MINKKFYNQTLIKEFKNYCKLELSDITTYHYVSFLKRFFEYCNIPLNKIKKKDIMMIYSSIIDKYNNSNTCNIVKYAIKKYVKFLNEIYEVNINSEYFDIKIPSCKIQKQLVTSSDDTLKIINKLSKIKSSTTKSTVSCFTNKRNILILLFACTTGIRRKELYGIKIDDLDLTNNLIYINNPKGNKKTRIVQLFPLVKTYLCEYLELRKEKVNKDVDELFITKDGTKLTLNTLSHLCMDISKQTGINITLHSFRRGLATELYNKNNANILDIAYILGHANVNTTIKHYIKVDSNRMLNVLQNHNLYNYNKLI